jgi:hypothetical protein
MTQSSKLRRRYEAPVLKKGPRLNEIVAGGAVKSPGAGVCWVARAAFGQDDIRWRIFRQWLMDDAPAWFRSAYFRFGPTLGAWLEGRNRTRSVVRRAMMVAIRKKLA